MPRRPKNPSYRLHTASGQGIVTLPDGLGGRRDVYLGVHNTPESLAEYDRVVAEWLANGRRLTPAPSAEGEPLSVNELILQFWHDAERRYGPGSKELVQYRYSLRPLKDLYGTTPAAKFGPVCLNLVMQHMVNLGWTRKVIGRRLSRIKAVFSWGVVNERIPGEVSYRLREVKGLRPGQYGVKESPGREPAFFDDAEKIVPHCTQPVGTMLRLQYLAGMRCGEVRMMRTMDLDMTNPDCWLYRPGSDAGPFGKHKNAWRGQVRVIALGPQAIAILKDWVRPHEPAAYLFSPKRFMEQREAQLRAKRKSKVQPSQVCRKKTKPKKQPGEFYLDSSYSRAVANACVKAGVKFVPYALRHGRKMDVEREHGSEAARAVLGQKSIETTTHYGKLDVAHASDVAKQMG